MTELMDKIGFVGLGLMGEPMARNLLNAGAQLHVFNRTASKADRLVADGATLSRSVKDLAKACTGGIIIICVSDTPAMVSTVDSMIQHELADTLIIDMGTSEVSATKDAAEKLTARGGSFVDAPVSGGAIGAQDGTLSIMTGGSAQDICRAAPVFDILGSAATHIGPIGAGQVAKAANQAIVGATLSIVAESLLLVESAGADPAKAREALLSGFAGSRILDLHGQRMIDRRFEPGGRAKTQSKDLRQAVDLAVSLGIDLPFLTKCRDLWGDMETQGMGDLDQSGYFAFAQGQQGT